MTTFNSGDGAMPGTYFVTVYKSDREPEAVHVNVPSSAAPQDALRMQYGEYLKQAGRRRPPPQLALPARYSDPLRTPLKCTVPHDGPVRLEVKSK